MYVYLFNILFYFILHIFIVINFYFFQVEEQVLDSLSWQSESPLWDLIDKNNKRIPHYDEIALTNVGGSSMSNINSKIENSRFPHKGWFISIFDIDLK